MLQHKSNISKHIIKTVNHRERTNYICTRKLKTQNVNENHKINIKKDIESITQLKKVVEFKSLMNNKGVKNL